MELTLKNLEDTKKLAQKLAKKILRKGSPSVVALYGDLGAGKTTFVQFFAKALDVKEKILSPTFVIIKTYVLPVQAGLRHKFFTHIDAYRLKLAKELSVLGLKDILKDKENITIIEWPEKIERYLPKNTKKIYFKTVGVTARRITIK